MEEKVLDQIIEAVSGRAIVRARIIVGTKPK